MRSWNAFGGQALKVKAIYIFYTGFLCSLNERINHLQFKLGNKGLEMQMFIKGAKKNVNFYIYIFRTIFLNKICIQKE